MAMPMEPGIYPDLSNEEYHEGPGISTTGIKRMLRSPFHYWSHHISPDRPPEKDRAGQLEGSLAHCSILEPDAFWERYATVPAEAPRQPTDRQINAKNPSQATLDAIEYWKRWREANEGKTLIKPEQAEVAFAQARAVTAQVPDMAEALSHGRAEQSAYWIDDSTGELCRCRPDWVHPATAGDILVDVKTFSNAKPGQFIRQVAKKFWHIQAAYYSDGWAKASGRDVLGFVFLAVEMEYPWGASATMLEDNSLDEGRDRYREALDKYHECRKANIWPSYSEAIEIMALPAYAFYGD